jgi:hypothetical protein
MATSPNFGWLEPDNTDLVKNGALAIRTAVNAIDASMADLKGGTTGQVLSKTSNTDMDFTWVAADDTNAIQNSIVDAKGDLIAATANDTPARLAVGNNGETLVADSSTSTGLRWQGNYAAAKNKILNSNCSIWQRGTSITVGAASYTYTADRFKVYSANTSTTVSRDTSAPTGLNYSLKLQRPNGNTGTNSLGVNQIIESINTTDLKGQYVTFSFWIKKGANYSGGNITATILTGTGTDQGGDPYGWTGLGTVVNDGSYSPTTSFVRVNYSGTVPTTVNEMAISISYTPTGTAGADDAIYVTGIQLEAGAMTTFQTATGNAGSELAACQRYLPAVIGLSYEAIGFAYGTTGSQYVVKLPVTARVAPTGMTVSNVSHFTVYNTGFSGGNPTAISMNTSSIDTFSFNATTNVGSPTLVASTPSKFQCTNAAGTLLFTGCEL